MGSRAAGMSSVPLCMCTSLFVCLRACMYALCVFVAARISVDSGHFDFMYVYICIHTYISKTNTRTIQTCTQRHSKVYTAGWRRLPARHVDTAARMNAYPTHKQTHTQTNTHTHTNIHTTHFACVQTNGITRDPWAHVHLVYMCGLEKGWPGGAACRHACS